MLDRIDELDIEIAKSGHDEFSRLRLSTLKERLPKEFEEVAAQISDPDGQAIALRWLLRGKTVEWAVGRVNYVRARDSHFQEEGHKTKANREITGY